MLVTFEEAVGPEVAAELAELANDQGLWEVFITLPKNFVDAVIAKGITQIVTIVALWDAIRSGGYGFRGNQVADRHLGALLLNKDTSRKLPA